MNTINVYCYWSYDAIARYRLIYLWLHWNIVSAYPVRSCNNMTDSRCNSHLECGSTGCRNSNLWIIKRYCVLYELMKKKKTKIFFVRFPIEIIKSPYPWLLCTRRIRIRISDSRRIRKKNDEKFLRVSWSPHRSERAWRRRQKSLP